LFRVGGAVGVGNDHVELEPEDAWLRYRVRRLRAILHRVKDPEALTLLHELISDAEERLDALEKMRARDMLK
jgi:bacterioferritin (cytochrome b1)